MDASPHIVATLPALEALFGAPGEASLRKQTATLPPGFDARQRASLY